MKLIIILLLVIFFSIVNIPSVLANNDDNSSTSQVKYEKINPGSPYYIFKRLFENIQLNYLSVDKKSKSKILSHLLEVRLKEIAYVVNNNKIGMIENVTGRYDSVAGTIMEKYKNVNPDLPKQIESYPQILSSLRDKFPANSAQWLLMQYTIDTTNRLK